MAGEFSGSSCQKPKSGDALNGRLLSNVGPLRAGTDAFGNAFCKPAAVAGQPCQQKGREHKRSLLNRGRSVKGLPIDCWGDLLQEHPTTSGDSALLKGHVMLDSSTARCVGPERMIRYEEPLLRNFQNKLYAALTLHPCMS